MYPNVENNHCYLGVTDHYINHITWYRNNEVEKLTNKQKFISISIRNNKKKLMTSWHGTSK